MATKINSYLGQIHLLGNNPRTIRDNAFNRLCESIERDESFLQARGIVVWLVPQIIPLGDGQKSPFKGQEGKLVVLGGNQRTKALLALGRKEIRKEWIIEAKDAEGNWWSPEQAERFVLLDNGGEGISGENDYFKMFENFSLDSMKLTGIDFSNLREMMDAATEKTAEKTPKEIAEEGEHGEKSPELKQFIENREETRKNLREIDDTGFHLLVCFESFEEKVEFISKAKLAGKNKRVAVNGDVYIDLVFESYDQKMEFARKASLIDEDDAEGEAKIIYEMFCDGRALASAMGIELKESGLHFRNRVVDNGLAEMAREESAQKTEGEIQEEQFEEAKRMASEGGDDEGVSEDSSANSVSDTENPSGGDEPDNGDGVAILSGRRRQRKPKSSEGNGEDAGAAADKPRRTRKNQKTLREKLGDFVD